VHTVVREQEGVVVNGERLGHWQGTPWYDNMRILAVEADFSAPGREYVDGYRGYTWVRVQQLADEFFEMRWARPKVGMDKVWEAAQQSKHQAFVSIDAKEAKSFTWSNDIYRMKGSLFYFACDKVEASAGKATDR